MKYIAIEMIQTLPTNNVNRGMDGEVKTTVFGGTLRQRVSSQCWKRPIRLGINEWCKVNNDDFGIFSRIHGTEIKARLEADGVVVDNIDDILASIGLGQKKANFDTSEKKKKATDEGDDTAKKDVIMYLSDKELSIICEHIKAGTFYKDSKGKASDKAKKEMKDLSDMLKDAGCRNPYEIATFGRMFASNGSLNTNGALRMNHPFSTHAIVREVDYFTAVDQLEPNGAGHIGDAEFTSSTVYRYIVIDLDQLKTNVKGEDFSEYLHVLLKTCVLAFPGGKTNTMNATTRPAYIGFTVANGIPCQHCNAFEKAIEPSSDGFEAPSIQKLKEYRTAEANSGFDDIILMTEWEHKNGTNINSVLDSVVSAAR